MGTKPEFGSLQIFYGVDVMHDAWVINQQGFDLPLTAQGLQY